jgi:hypothetical protein
VKSATIKSAAFMRHIHTCIMLRVSQKHIYIYAIYNRIFDDFSAKITVYAPYINK